MPDLINLHMGLPLDFGYDWMNPTYPSPKTISCFKKTPIGEYKDNPPNLVLSEPPSQRVKNKNEPPLLNKPHFIKRMFKKMSVHIH